MSTTNYYTRVFYRNDVFNMHDSKGYPNLSNYVTNYYSLFSELHDTDSAKTYKLIRPLDLETPGKDIAEEFSWEPDVIYGSGVNWFWSDGAGYVEIPVRQHNDSVEPYGCFTELDWTSAGYNIATVTNFKNNLIVKIEYLKSINWSGIGAWEHINLYIFWKQIIPGYPYIHIVPIFFEGNDSANADFVQAVSS